MEIGKTIKELRINKGITQEELAALTELSARTIQRIENGEVDPRAYTLQMIAKALEVDFSLFVSGSTEKKEELKDTHFYALLHLIGFLPLIFPTLIIWRRRKHKTKNLENHFRAALIMQLCILIICLVGLWIYWKMNQSTPFFMGLLVGGLVSVFNTISVFSGRTYINPFMKPEGS